MLLEGATCRPEATLQAICATRPVVAVFGKGQSERRVCAQSDLFAPGEAFDIVRTSDIRSKQKEAIDGSH